MYLVINDDTGVVTIHDTKEDAIAKAVLDSGLVKEVPPVLCIDLVAIRDLHKTTGMDILYAYDLLDGIPVIFNQEA